MSTEDFDTGVIYLVWLPYGIEHFKLFLGSYTNFKADHPHQLIIVFNGTELPHKNKPEEYIKHLEKFHRQNVEYYYYEQGQDIDIYRKIAAQLNYEYLLFLNTYSKIENDSWLNCYTKNKADNIGLIGATASYAGYIRSINKKFKKEIFSNISWKQKINSLKYVLKLNLFYRNKFGKFPNPHIRTTGFFIRKNIFCSLNLISSGNKREAYYFENGTNSLTNQVLALGFQCILIDKYGNPYPVKEWPASKIFWRGKQEGLLISDNQTRKYDHEDLDGKKHLEEDAWGKT